jgi:hypothetical protein
MTESYDFSKLRTGDVITYDMRSNTTKVDGKWKKKPDDTVDHVSIYLGTINGIPYVIDSGTNGVTIREMDLNNDGVFTNPVQDGEDSEGNSITVGGKINDVRRIIGYVDPS